VRTDGPNVIVTIEAPNADLPYLMSDYHMPIMPAIDGRIDPTSTDGCGGYIVDKLRAGRQRFTDPHDGYWKTDRAHFDGLLLLSIPIPWRGRTP
jgi:peptide/nickel transport system substrate-binding protein